MTLGVFSALAPAINAHAITLDQKSFTDVDGAFTISWTGQRTDANYVKRLLEDDLSNDEGFIKVDSASVPFDSTFMTRSGISGARAYKVQECRAGRGLPKCLFSQTITVEVDSTHTPSVKTFKVDYEDDADAILIEWNSPFDQNKNDDIQRFELYLK